MIRALSLAFGLAVASLAVPALAVDAIYPPGSRIGLVPPSDMSPMRGLTGFRSLKSGSAILTIEMPPEAFPSLAAGFTDEALKAQGFTVKQRERPRIGSGEAILVAGEQAQNGQSITKVVLLAADPTMTALVIGQLAPGASGEDTATIETALKTVAFRAPLSLDERIAALPFRIVDMAGFRSIRTMAGNSLLLTDGPDDVIRNVSQPVLIVAQSFAPAPGQEQHESFARSALVSNTFVKDTVLERSQAYRQNGQNWHEIVAKATDTQSGEPVIIQQTILFEPDGYLRVVGIVKPDQRDAILPRFRRLTDSIVVP